MGNGWTALSIFALAFAAFSLAPHSGSNTQVVTRLGLTLSLVESGRFDIDRFAEGTIDKARVGGHYYADKAPGLSFLAIPAVAVAAFVTRARTGKFDSSQRATFSEVAKIATISVNAFLSALAAAVLYLTAIRLGATPSGALFAAGALAFGTPFLGWSINFYAHSVSGSLLLFAAGAIAFAFTGKRIGYAETASFLFGLGLGTLLGFTIVVDLTTAPACLLGGLLTLALAWRRDAFALTTSGLLLGGILGVLPLLVYNMLAFGSPFTLGYSAVVGFEGMQQGLFGVTWPSSKVVFELLFGFYRGLLPLSPVLALIPVGLYMMWQESHTRIAASVILLTLCIFLWINASYYYWDGGYATGPRHLVPILPLGSIALAFAWPRTAWAQAAAVILLSISFILSLICVAGGMFAPQELRNPLVELLIPKFLTPKGLMRSLPIVVVWLAFGLMLYRSVVADTERRVRRTSTMSSHPVVSAPDTRAQFERH
jgi:hypothetical protein